MQAFPPECFRTSNEYPSATLEEESDCCEAALQKQLGQIVRAWEMAGRCVGHDKKSISSRRSCCPLKSRRMCSVALLLGSILLLCSISGRAAFGVPPTEPLENTGSPGGYVGGEDGGEEDIARGSDGQEEISALPSDTVTIPEQMHEEQLVAPPRQQQQQQQQQQRTAPPGGKIAPSLPVWMDVFRVFSIPKHLSVLSQPPSPARVPQTQSNAGGRPLTAGPEVALPGMLPQFEPKGGGVSAYGTKGEKPCSASISPLFQLASLKNSLSWLTSGRQPTPAEEQEEALADAIIHGTGKKQVPRIKTAVDTLIDAIEDQKLQQVANNPRQLEHLRKRREADLRARKSAVQIPAYFATLAKEAAAYHHEKHKELQKWEKEHPVGSIQHQLRTLARRRHQKDKLLLWREGQIYQSPEEGPELEKQLAEAQKTDRELDLLLLRDLSKEDLQWATGEDIQNEGDSGSREHKGDEDKN